jgi:hypothetical protein
VILARTCFLVVSAGWLLLGTSACGTADPNLFGSGPVQSGGSVSAGNPSVVVGGSSGTEAGGSGSGSSGGAESVAGSTGSLPSVAGTGSVSGCAFSCGDGGRAGSGGSSGSNLGDAAASGSDQAGSGSELVDCSPLAAGATYLPSTQHCYLVDTELRTFADAQAHCKDLNAHLVTLSDQAENDFAWSIHSDEHWIGSQDGRAPKQSGVGTYTWITGEPFDYTYWSPGQPNASKTDCVDGGSCYEHCAFQWKGGDKDSQWNDRYCMHTIVSICEWDSAP